MYWISARHTLLLTYQFDPRLSFAAIVHVVTGDGEMNKTKQTKPNPPPSRPRCYSWYYRASHPWHEWIFQEFYHFSILNLFVTACYLWQFSMDYQEENVRRNENIHPCNGMGLKLVFCELTQPTVMTRALLFTETILEIWSVKYVIQLFQFDPKDWIGIRSRYLYLYTCSWLYSQQNTWYVQWEYIFTV